ncbi:MAG: hypothetical protein V3T31_01625 [candidate division Zixibacteria bacterium]
MNRDLREYLAGYVDGELTESERVVFEEELKRDPQLQSELDEFRKLKEVTGMIRYADLPLEVWEGYWQSIYSKLERGTGWILLSIGAIGLILFGLFHFFNELYFNPKIPLLVSIGVTILTIGGVILLVSFIRERLFAYNRDRYRKVIR